MISFFLTHASGFFIIGISVIGATLLMPLIYKIHFLLRYLIVLAAVAALGSVLLRGRRPAGNDKNGGNDEATDL